MSLPVIVLVGNPNVGKSTLFNALTGQRQHTSNWTGTTVHCAQATGWIGPQPIKLVDLPGAYSLTPYSAEETATRDFILYEHIDLVLNVVDAANLERNLYLTVQLLETGLPLVVVLNKMDVATRRKVDVDVEHLSRTLSVPVVTTVAGTGSDDLTDLRTTLAAFLTQVDSTRTATVGP